MANALAHAEVVVRHGELEPGELGVLVCEEEPLRLVP
jgi:hypothetical protein